MPKANTFFSYDSLRTACPKDVTCMGPLIMACYMHMHKSIRTADLMGIGVFRMPLKSAMISEKK
jgi:hypothetical protein